jgi:REP element-mobilizing transposase RayT
VIIREEIELDMDEFVVMPNHIHGIVVINPQDSADVGDLMNEKSAWVDGRGTGDRPVARTNAGRPIGPAKKSLGAFVAGYKSSVTTQINALRGTPGQPVWLRNYYEHIICTEKEYNNIVNYIHDNPQNWKTDNENNH